MTTPALLISLFGLLMLGDGITGIRESDSEDDAAGMAFVITTSAAGLGCCSVASVSSYAKTCLWFLRHSLLSCLPRFSPAM